MGNILKIDNVLLKRFKQKEILSGKKKREVVVYFLIVCEGEKTEPNYFKSFPKRVGTTIHEIKTDGGGLSTLRVVEKAIELRNDSPQKYDRVWAVFDKDSFKSSDFNSAIKKARANNIKCAWSNEAFELWYLLHFHNRITAMDRTQYKKAIEDALNEKKLLKKPFKYQKNHPDMLSVLTKYGNQDQAIKWAKKLHERVEGERYSSYNPVTVVYQLVEELIGKSAELNDEIMEQYNKEGR
jgi:hypothetical protein